MPCGRHPPPPPARRRARTPPPVPAVPRSNPRSVFPPWNHGRPAADATVGRTTPPRAQTGGHGAPHPTASASLEFEVGEALVGVVQQLLQDLPVALDQGGHLVAVVEERVVA